MVKAEKRPKDGLAVRESPAKGVYVEGCESIPVASYFEIQKAIDKGTMNRTVGATNMNATSSRAHTVTGILFK